MQPTGAGKSTIYQIAGWLIEGVTVVIAPLIALQKDQVDSINSQNAAEGVVVNKKVSEIRETFEKIADGAVEYIFLAPEQLRKQETLDRLEAARVSLFGYRGGRAGCHRTTAAAPGHPRAEITPDAGVR